MLQSKFLLNLSTKNEGMYSNFKSNLERQGLTVDLYEQFTGKTSADLKEEMRKQMLKEKLKLHSY